MRQPQDELGEVLLRSARGDSPSASARQRTALALGIGVAGASVAATSHAGLHGSMVATSATSATSAASAASLGVVASSAGTGILGASLAFKLTLAIVAGGMIAGAVVLPRKTVSPAPRVPTVEAPVAAAPARASLPTSESAWVPSTVPVGGIALPPVPTPQENPGVVSPAPVPAVPIVPAVPTVRRAGNASIAPDLTAAMGLLDRAKSAIAANDPVHALAILHEYDAQFPDGALGPEASVLRIEALVAKGDNAEAVALADRFLAKTPNSPHARRVRSLVLPIREPRTNQ